MTPSDIEKMFTIPLDQMPKMSSPATGKPNYTTLDKFQKAINKQALSIPSATYPDLGWIGQVIPNQDFANINNGNIFVAPANPGIAPTQPAGATGPQIAEIVRQHELAANEFTVFNHTRTQLRNMIINNIEDKYICALANDVTSYNQVSPLTILTHLWDNYGQIKEADLSANEQRMYADWNPPTPIETLYEQLVEGQRFAARGNEIIDNSQLVRKGYDIIKKTGLFEDDCKKWRNKPEAERTWTNFQAFFTEADNDRRQNTPTSGTAGYSANDIEELVNSQMNSILQTFLQAEDASTTDNVPPPSDSHQQRDTANAAITIEDLRNEITKMQWEMQGKRKNRRKDPPPAQGKDDNGDNITYCWSHGITKNLWHNSMTCKRCKEGHKKESTLQNKMGGSEERCKARGT